MEFGHSSWARDSFPALMRIFDEVSYRQLEGSLLEGIARLFGYNVRVLAYPCPRKDLLDVIACGE